MSMRLYFYRAALACLICLGIMPVLAQAQAFTLQISVQDAQYAEPGSISPAAGARTYASGEAVTLTARARQGYTYHWECTAAPSIHNQTGDVSLVMNRDYAVRLVFAPNYYSLTVDNPPQGGAVEVQSPVPADMSRIAAGTTVTVEAKPATGYSFVLWHPDPADESLSPAPSSSKVSVYMSRDVRLVPEYAKEKYIFDVVYNPAPIGGLTTGGGYYTIGEIVNITATPNAGFIFDGWEVSGGTVAVANASAASTTATLGAPASSAWKVTARFKVADPQQTTLIVECAQGGSVEATPDPPPNVGTTTIASGDSAMLSVPAGKSVKLKVKSNDSNRYSFAGWDGPVNSPSATNTTVVVSAATTVRAKFKALAKNFTVAAEAASGYEASGIGASKLEAVGLDEEDAPLTASTGGVPTRPFQNGRPVVLTATPAPGHAFAGWKYTPGVFSAAEEAALSAQIPSTGVVTATVIMPARVATVTATFLKIPGMHTLALNAYEGGGATATGTFTHPVTGITSTIGIIADGSGMYQEGTPVSLTAAPSPATHFKFVRWDGAGVANPASASTTVSMSTGRTVTAIFERTHADLAVSVSPAGAGSVVDQGSNLPPALTHPVGTTVNLRPLAANDSWTFKEWKVDGVASGSAIPLSVLMNANRSVEALFMAQHYLGVNVSPAAGGNASGANHYLTGATASINITPNNGWIFDQWSGDIAGITPGATTKAAQVVMTSDRTITANMIQGKNVRIFAAKSADSTETFDPGAAASSIKATGSFYRDAAERSSICHQSGGIDSAYAKSGGIITLSAPATVFADGIEWKFVHWVEGVSDSGSSVGPSYTVTADVTLCAIYTNQRVLTGNVIVDGTINPAGTSLTVASSSLPAGSQRKLDYSTSSISVSAPPVAGKIFTKWTGNVDNADAVSSTNTVTMNADKTITANYFASHTLTTGIVTVPAGASLNVASLVTVSNARASSPPAYTFASIDNANVRAESTVTTDSGVIYRFKGWDTTGRNDGTIDSPANPISVPMTADKTVKAVYVRQIQVTFQTGSGSGTGSTNPSGVRYYDSGTNVIFSATPSPGTGSVFDYWTAAPSVIFGSGTGSPSNFVNNITADTVITAHFNLEQNPLTARILVDGATPAVPAVIDALTITADGNVLKNDESKAYIYGVRATIEAATPSLASGFRFKGWVNQPSDFTPAGSSATLYMFGAKTVTASYESIHTLTLDQETRPSSAGVGGTVSAAGSLNQSGNIYDYAHNQDATLTATPNPGFQFIGWLIDGGTTPVMTSSIAMGANHTAKAVFAREYTLTLAVNPDGAGATNPAAGTPSICYFGQEVLISTSSGGGSGYNFVSWTSSLPSSAIENAGLASTKITIAGDTIATANYTATAVTLKLDINVDGTVKPDTFTDLSITADGDTRYSTQTKSYSYNATASLAATPSNAVYRFTGWSSNVASGAPASNGTATIGLGTTTVTAYYKTLHTVTIETETLPSGAGGAAAATDANHESATGNVYTYTHGAGATFVATASSGYRFIRWEIYANGSATPSNTYVTPTLAIVVNNDMIAKAVFAKEYTLTFTPSPASGGSINKPATYIAYHGEVITNITATPAAGGYWEFEKWSVPLDILLDNSTTNPIASHTVTGSQDFTARFRQAAAGVVTLTVAIKLDDEPTASTTFSVTADGSTLEGFTSPSVLHGGDSKQYFINDTVKLDAASALPGYDFIGWDDNSTNPHREFSIAASRTVTALYRTKSSLTMAINPAGIGVTTPAVGTHTSILPTPGNLYKGMTVDINSTLDAAYTDTMAFVGWTVNTGANVANPSMGPTSVLLDVPAKAATANYTPGYKLEVRVKYETTASPAAAKTFGVATGSRSSVATGAGNRAGIYLSDPNSLDYSVRTIAQNTHTNVSAIPSAPGYTFVGWTLNPDSDTPDAGLGASTLSVLMDAPKVYTAIFEKTRVKLEVFTIPSGVTGVRGEAIGGKLTAGPEPRVYEFFYGARPSLKATSDNPAYGFVAWFKGSGYTTEPTLRFSTDAATLCPEALTAPVTQVMAYFLPYGLHRLILFVEPDAIVDIHHVKVPGAVSQTYTTVDGFQACIADVGINDPYSVIPIHADSSPTGKPKDDAAEYSFQSWKPGPGEAEEVISWVRQPYDNDTDINYPMARQEVRLTALYANIPAYRLRLQWKLSDPSLLVDSKYEDSFLTVGHLNDLLGNVKGDTIRFGYPLLLVNREVQIKDGIFEAGHIENFDVDEAFANGPFTIDYWTDERPDGTIINSTPPGAGVMTFSSQPGITGTSQTVTAHVEPLWFNIGLDQPVLLRPDGWQGTTITGDGMFTFLDYDETRFPSDIFLPRQVPDALKYPSTLVMQWQRVKDGSAPVLIAAGTPANYRFAGWDINNDGEPDFTASNFNWTTWPAQWAKPMTADRTVAPVYVRQLPFTLAMQAPDPTETLDRAYFTAPMPTGGIEVNKSYLLLTKTYDYNSAYTVTAEPQANHVLQKWIIEKAIADGGAVFGTPVEIGADGSPGAKTLAVTLDYPTKVTAVFAMQKFALTVDVAAGLNGARHGKIKLNNTPAAGSLSETRAIPYGDSPAIEAEPDDGYVFTGWTVSPSDLSLPANPASATTTVRVDGTKTVTAHFERAVTLTMAVEPSTLPANILNPAVGLHSQYEGKPLIDSSVVPISSGTDGGYDFVKWQIEDTGTRTISNANATLTLNGNTKATAVYARLFDVEIQAAPATLLSADNNKVTATPAPKTGGPMTAIANSGGAATGAYRENTDVTFTATPSAHYTFDHWELTINGIAQPAPYSTSPTLVRTITAPTIAKAVFTPKNYTITVAPYTASTGTLAPIASSLDGATTADVTPQSHDFLPPPQSTGSETWTLPYGSSVTLSTTPANHYAFEKWTDASHSVQLGILSSGYAFTVSGNQTILAQFKRTEFFLTTALDPGTTAGAITSEPSRTDNPSTHPAGATVTLTAVSNNSADFLRWSGDTGAGVTDTNPVLPLTMNADRLVTAHFVGIVRLAVTNPDPAVGRITVEGSGIRRTEVIDGVTYYIIEAGTPVTITATPANAAQYQFDNWTFNPAGVTGGDLTNSTITFTAPTTPGESVSVSANFSPCIYNLTVEARVTNGQSAPFADAPYVRTLNTSGVFAGSSHDFLITPTITVAYGTNILLSTEAGDYYRLVHWTDGNHTGSLSLFPYEMPAQDSTVVALFERSLYKLTARVNPAGGGAIAATPSGGADPRSTPDTTVYAPNTRVVLEAFDTPGKVFTGWSGAGAGATTRSLNLVMNGDLEVTANFANIRTVTIPDTPNGTVIVSGHSPHAEVTTNPDGSKTYIFVEGATATITAVPKPLHYYIYAWDFSPDISASVTPNPGGIPPPSTISFAVNADVTVAPDIKPRAYTLTVTPNPSGGAAALVGHEFGSLDHDFLAIDTVSRNYPTVMTLEATAKDEPAARYRFDSWQEGGIISGDAGTHAFTFDRNTAFAANFVRQVQITINAPQDVTPANNAPPVSVCGTVTPGAGTHRYDVTTAIQTVTITATAAEGFEFAGWTGNVGNATTNNVTTTETASTATLTYAITSTLAGENDIVLTPTFRRRLYTVNLSIWEKGQGLPTVCGLLQSIPPPDAGSNKYYYGTVFNARVSQVYTGYRFVGWGLGDDIAASRVVQQAGTGELPEILAYTVTADKHISAVFTRVCVLEAISDPADGTKGTAVIISPAGRPVTGQPAKQEFDYGTRVYIQAVPESGASFIGWAGAVNDPNALDTYVDMETDRRVIARFNVTVYRDLTVKVAPSSAGKVTIDGNAANVVGAGNPSTITLQMLDGVTAQLVAAPEPGYAFSNWSPAGAITVTNPNVPSTGVLMDASKTVTANFTACAYTLTVQASPVAGGSVGGGGTTFAYNATANINATAKPGYTFKGWDTDGDGQIDDTSPSSTIRMTSDRVASAYFTPIGQTGITTLTVLENVDGTWVQNAGAVSYSNISSPPNPLGYVTITCVLAPGYTVEGGVWGGPDIYDAFTQTDDDGTGTYTIDVPSDHDMVIYFLVSRTRVRLTWAALPTDGGSVEFVPAGGFYRAGTTVRVIATPNGNNTFSKWQGDLSGTSSDTTITVNRNSHIEALFHPSNTWAVTLSFDVNSKCDLSGDDTVTMNGETLRQGDHMELVRYYTNLSHVPLSYELVNPANHIFGGWLGAPVNAIWPTVKPNYDLYVACDMDIRALIQPANPLIETKIIMQDASKDLPPGEKTNLKSIGGSISLGGVVTLGQEFTVRVTLEDNYKIDHWGTPTGTSTLEPGEVTGTDPESGKRYVERKVKVNDMYTLIEVFLADDAGAFVLRRNIVDGGKDRHDDVPKNKSSGHFIDGHRE